MSLYIQSHLLEGNKKIRSPGEQENLDRIDSYLAVLEDNRKSAAFIPTDAALALDMANFVFDRLQGRRERKFVPAMRLSMALLQTSPTDSEQ
ncbi:MAG: hypothetical protein IK079_04010 [Desulfovibrio sp.]|nr:hypothetical protein [Desulfovibrio sp.]